MTGTLKLEPPTIQVQEHHTVIVCLASQYSFIFGGGDRMWSKWDTLWNWYYRFKKKKKSVENNNKKIKKNGKILKKNLLWTAIIH